MGVVESWKRVIPAPVLWIALLAAALFLLTGNWASTALMTVFLVVFAMTIGAQKLAAVRDHWGRLTAAQKAQAVGIIGTFAVVLGSIKATTTDAHMEIVRQQFHLQADTVFDGFKSRMRGKGGGERIEAIVRFSDRDFRTYAALVEDVESWHPVAFKYEGRVITGTYDEDALRWERSLRPAFAGAVRVRWGHLSREQEPHAPNRRTLCFAALPLRVEASAQDGPRKGMHHDGAETFKISACRNVPRDEYPLVYVLAVLDYDTKSLHVIFN